MKVLMLSWEYPPHIVGGLGKHVMELLPALTQQGIEVHLVTPRWNGGDFAETVVGRSRSDQAATSSKVYRVEPPLGDMTNFVVGATRTNVALEQFAGQVWEESGPFDLVHAHDWLVAPAAIALKQAHKTPLITTIHATEYGRCRGNIRGDVPRAINDIEWRLTYEAWRVICCSGFMSNEVQTALGAPSDKIEVIPNGVETSRFDKLADEDLADFRTQFAAPDEKIVFYVGRVVHEKGVHLVVDAMPLILARNPKVKLVVAGTGGSLNAIRERARDLGVGLNCFFTGFIPDATRDRLFRVADVAAFPSLYEPFGIVALEAMAARTPVVVADVGGLSEVVKHAETGITVFPDNVDSLVWGIMHVIDHPDWARERAITAYRDVVENYNWKAIASKTIGVYERVRGERQNVSWT